MRLWNTPVGLVMLGWSALCLVACGGGGTAEPTDPTASAYSPTAPHPITVGPRLMGPELYTIDARSRDVWIYFAFAANSVVPVQHPQSDPWDLAFQRYIIKTNGGATNPTGQGALFGVKERDFTAVTRVPEQAAFVQDVHPKNRGASFNPVIEKWFDYSYLANVLAPKQIVYVVRTHDGKYAKMRIRSYYCEDKSAGCLTFEYVYQGDGSLALAPPAA